MDNENTTPDILDTLSSDVGAADGAPDLETATPLEVISVDELLDRLASASETEETTEAVTEDTDPEETEPTLADQFFAASLDDTSSTDTVQLLTEIRDALPDDHPLLTTEFEDYTVAEGLLLSLFLCVVGSWCVRMVKGGFSWLLS